MASSIHIAILGTTYNFSAVLQENPTLEVSSEFSSFGELIGDISQLVTTVTTVSGLGGQISKGLVDLGNKLDMPRWTRTNPLKFQTSLTFYTKTNPFFDVWFPANLLMNMCILSKGTKTGTYIVPGLSLANMNAANNATGVPLSEGDIAQANGAALDTEDIPTTGDFPATGKICSVRIPGVVHMAAAFFRSVQVTASKQRTTSGYPLWMKLEIPFEGLYPATDEILSASKVIYSERL